MMIVAVLEAVQKKSVVYLYPRQGKFKGPEPARCFTLGPGGQSDASIISNAIMRPFNRTPPGQFTRVGCTCKKIC